MAPDETFADVSAVAGLASTGVLYRSLSGWPRRSKRVWCIDFIGRLSSPSVRYFCFICHAG